MESTADRERATRQPSHLVGIRYGMPVIESRVYITACHRKRVSRLQIFTCCWGGRFPGRINSSGSQLLGYGRPHAPSRSVLVRQKPRANIFECLIPCIAEGAAETCKRANADRGLKAGRFRQAPSASLSSAPG